MLVYGKYIDASGLTRYRPLRVNAAGQMLQGGHLQRSNVSIDSLGTTETAYTDILDLGDPMCSGIVIARKMGLASAGEVMQLEFSDNQITWEQGVHAITANGHATNSNSNANLSLQGYAHRRYARAKFLNGATVQSATATLSIVFNAYF